MLDDGKYDDISSTSRTERRERRRRGCQFAAYIFGLFSTGFLLFFAFSEHEWTYLFDAALFAAVGLFYFWLHKRSGRRSTRRD